MMGQLVPTGRTLSDAAVSDVCKTLFGDAIDTDALLGISKMGPDPADLNSAGSTGTRSFQAGKKAGEMMRRRPSRKTVATAGLGYTIGNARGRRKGRENEQFDQYRRARQYAEYERRSQARPSAYAEGVFSKFDDDKQLAFGWASIVELNGQPVVDKQNDYISIDDLEEAAYTYVHKSRVGGNMHRRNGDRAHHVSDMIESIVFTDDKIAKMGLPDDFPRGWWVGFKVHDPQTWAEVRKGERTGFSIHGKGTRKDASLDEVMGYGGLTKAFDPEERRQHRRGQQSGAAGTAGAGLAVAGAGGIARDTRNFSREYDAMREQAADYNSQARQAKKRTLRGTNQLKEMGRRGQLRGSNKAALVLSRRNVAALAAGGVGIGTAAALDRDARSSRGRAWN